VSLWCPGVSVGQSWSDTLLCKQRWRRDLGTRRQRKRAEEAAVASREEVAPVGEGEGAGGGREQRRRQRLAERRRRQLPEGLASAVW
jgi:hypothetical protein